MKDIKNEYIFDLMKNKDPKGFELMYKHHFRTMYGVAFTIVKDESRSYDVVQNVMVKLYRLPYEKFPTSNELTWIYKVTKNEALQLLRKEKTTIDINDISEIKEHRSSIDEFTDMENYYDLIKTLNDKQKNVITLKVLGGLSHKEIAKMLNKPMGTIQWIYNTSIKKLRMSLTVLSALVLVSGTTFGYKMLNYYNSLSMNIPEMELPEVKPVTSEIGSDLIITSIFFAVSIISLIIFFKKSEKIPTN
ncbi:RNA polymerase sigma factor [Wukongibacter sp. M2B1]|uniref:RNA polymerase sigma factor n=1 Tax=Wukongibacter sp. M2B1 TaxID=3088895 RepID=UPI003D7BB25F